MRAKTGKRLTRVAAVAAHEQGVDLQKIYNKHRDSDERHVRVQRDERLIADVISIEMDKTNPAAFVIRFRDGPGGEAVRKYEAEDGPEVAAEIVAKVRFLMSGRLNAA